MTNGGWPTTQAVLPAGVVPFFEAGPDGRPLPNGPSAAGRPMLGMEVTTPGRAAVARAGSGGAPRDADPYHVKSTAAAARDAEGNLLHGLDEMAAQEGAIGESVANRDLRTADLKEGAALARLGREQEIQEQNELQQTKLQTWVDESAKLNEQLSQEGIDPNHFMADKTTADRLAMGVGGILGGILSVQPGMGGRNPFMDNMNSLIERDIRSQEQNMANRRASLNQRDNLLGQYMKIHGDKQMAKLQASDRIWQNMQETIEAQGLQSGSAIVRERAKQAGLGIQQHRLELQDQTAKLAAQKAELAARTAMQQRAAAAAAQARARAAAEEKAWKRTMEMEELNLKKRAQASKEKGDEDEDKTFPQRKFIADAEAKLSEQEKLVQPLVQQLALRDDKGDVVLGPDGQPQIDLRKELPGTSRASRALGAVAGAVGLEGAVFSDQENINRSTMEKLRLKYQVNVTGAGGSEEQMKQITSAWEGAKTTADIANAIAIQNAIIKDIRAQARSAAGPRATAQYDRDMASRGQGQMPGSVKRK